LLDFSRINALLAVKRQKSNKKSLEKIAYVLTRWAEHDRIIPEVVIINFQAAQQNIESRRRKHDEQSRAEMQI
jgi:hypothetical protein